MGPPVFSNPLFANAYGREIREAARGTDPLSPIKIQLYNLAYNSDPLANKLLNHYMSAKGSDYWLAIEEMRAVKVRASIRNKPRRESAKNFDSYIQDAKKLCAGGIDGRVQIIDYWVAGGALANGTLGQFSIIYDGNLFWRVAGYWEFFGFMKFFDIWDFDSHRGKQSERTATAESKVEFASKYIGGTPFNVYSYITGVKESEFNDESAWFGSYAWSNYAKYNKLNKGME